MSLGWDEIDFEIWVCEVSCHSDLFILSELRFLHVFLVQNLLLGVAQVHERCIQLSLRNARHLLDLLVSQCLISIEEQENDSLVAVYYESIVLGCNIAWLNLNVTMMKQPCEVSVLVLVPIEVLKSFREVFHFRW